MRLRQDSLVLLIAMLAPGTGLLAICVLLLLAAFRSPSPWNVYLGIVAGFVAPFAYSTLADGFHIWLSERTARRRSNKWFCN